ncbi:MAG: putative sugar O-methyltransferase [Verrucomicrobia bacterium]|nr:putative sugar O-methyltransferase [Verrucomicrobiota bacterium]
MNRAIHPAGLRTLLWFYLGRLKQGVSSPEVLEPRTRAYLHPGNPRLVELRGRYDALKAPPHSCWASWERCIDLERFRAENAYQSQAYFLATLDRYRLTTAYVEARDEQGWLRSLGEDGRFGAKLWPVARGLNVTRDLLDSILELAWLKEMLDFGMDDIIPVLDIGAGYGRLAHRFASLFPRGSITCVDAIATSTFLCEIYLKYRRCERCQVLPFDEIGELQAGQFTLATNIHSWSEMPLAWVKHWLGLLSDLSIPYLFLVPNFADFRTREPDGSHGDFGPELGRHGYRCISKSRKYRYSAVADELGVFPGDYYLFQKR